MGEPQKDFLALTHGEEWVNFYESFDKLVQDNLARSSDLLKRAMTLPEVADREVAKIKDDHETKLSAERDRQRGVLSGLRDEVTGSQRQISSLTKGLGDVIADLERLSGRITAALATIEADIAAAPAAITPPSTPAAAPVAAAAVAKPVTAPLTPPARQTGPLAAVAEPAPAPEPAIDLNALAEAEADKPAGEAAPAEDLVAASAAPASPERQRPAWLSVARMNSVNNN